MLVGPMEPDELRRAIEAPAARAGLEVEPPLVDALVAEVEGQPGALPLLSTTLLELWRLRGGGVLRYETYRAAGGVDGAVARLAEQTYARLDDGEREAARRILLRLADEGPDAPVRRRVPLAQLGDEAVLETLADARLVTVGDGFAEVAHEALLRDWPRLRDWLEADAEGRAVHRELAAHAEAWDARGRDEADLYRGARLAAAVEWADAHQGDANETERAFLAASQRAAQRALRRLRWIAGGLAALLAVAIAAGAVAFVQRQSARRDARVALASRLGAQAVAEPRLDRALLLAREAVRLDDTPATEQELLATLLRSPALLASYDLPDGTRPYRVAVSPDGRTLFVGDSAGALRFFDARTRVETRPPLRSVFAYAPVATTPDGTKLVAVASPPHALAVLDARTLRKLRLLPLDRRFDPNTTGAVTPLEVTPRAAFFAYDLVIDPQGDEGPAYLDRLDLATGRRTTVRLGSPDVVGAGLVHGDPVTVTSRLIETWDPRTLRRLRAVRIPVRLGGYAAVDPRGRYAIGLAHFGGTIVFVDLRTGRVTPANGPEAPAVRSRSPSRPTAALPATAGADGRVTLWDPATGAALDTFAGHAGAANGIAFSPDGRTLYASSLDGTVLAWAVDQARRFGVRFDVPPAAAAAAERPANATGRGHPRGLGRARRERARGLRARLPPAGRSRSTGRLVTALASTPALLAVGRAGGGVELWSGGRRVRPLRGLPTNVQSLAFAAVASAPRRRRRADARDLEPGDRRAPPRPPAPGRGHRDRCRARREPDRGRPRRRPRSRRGRGRRDDHDAPPARHAERLARVPPGRDATHRLVRRRARALGRPLRPAPRRGPDRADRPRRLDRGRARRRLRPHLEPDERHAPRVVAAAPAARRAPRRPVRPHRRRRHAGRPHRARDRERRPRHRLAARPRLVDGARLPHRGPRAHRRRVGAVPPGPPAAPGLPVGAQ